MLLRGTLTRNEKALTVACDDCGAVIGERCKWVISGYVDESFSMSHPVRYIASNKPMRAYWSLWIYVQRRWECHKSSTPALRDELRAIWQRAGHATAVEL